MFASLTAPSADQVMQLPAAVSEVVQSDWIDANGHMNFRRYIDIGESATVHTTRGIGITDEYRQNRHMGIFTVEQHVRYLGELLLGTPVSSHVRVLDRDDKVVHMMAITVDRRENRVACIFETMLIHVSLESRRALPLPADVAAAFDQLIDDQSTLTWPAPQSGSMAIRRA